MLIDAAKSLPLQPQFNPNQVKHRAASLAALDDLQAKLHDAQVDNSLASFEGIVEPLQAKSEAQAVSNTDNLLQNTIPILGYSLASALHTIAAINRTVKFLPKSIGDFIDNNVQYLSKIVNTGVFASKSKTAFGAKQGCDALGRLLNPLAVWFAPQEDMYLASGFSSGSTMINFSQKHLNNDKYKSKSNLKNIQDHFNAYMKKWTELLQGGFWGPKSKVTLNPKKNKGHLMFIGGNLNFLGAALGMTLGRGSHFMKAIGSIVRNTGSVVSDIAKMIDEDKNFVYAGIIYGVVSVFDVWQAVINNKERSRTLSHITQALNNFANYFYTKPSDNAANRLKAATRINPLGINGLVLN